MDSSSNKSKDGNKIIPDKFERSTQQDCVREVRSLVVEKSLHKNPVNAKVPFYAPASVLSREMSLWNRSSLSLSLCVHCFLLGKEEERG